MTEADLRKQAAAFRKSLAPTETLLKKIADQLDAVLKKMESPGKRSARTADEAHHIDAQPNHTGQLPQTVAEFGETAKPAS